MESAVMLRSFNGSLCTTQHGHALLEMPAVTHISKAALQSVSFSRVSVAGRSLSSSTPKRRGSHVQLLKASETTAALTSDDSSNKPDGGLVEKNNNRGLTFPNGFKALVLEVCDETQIAELKLKVLLAARNTSEVPTANTSIKCVIISIRDSSKQSFMACLQLAHNVGGFELHMKRDIGPKATTVSPILSPAMAPPAPSNSMVESAPAAQPSVPSKSPPTSNNPFANVATTKASKLAALEASGASDYILVSSTTVGTFRKGRTVKGKKQPPSCQEGTVIKEGHTICYLDQFGNELPVKSDVGGKVLKVLFEDGEAVGYGDPLIAVLP